MEPASMSTSGSLRPIPAFDLALTGIYAAVIGVLLYKHAMFSDEGQEWLIARASHSLRELYLNRRYEGHPITWYLVIWPFARASADIDWIKLPNFFFSIAACWLTLRWHLRGPVEKVFFVFGALFIFYYSVLARPYMLGYLLLATACHYATVPGRRAIAIVLGGLMATIHIYFAIIGAALLVWQVWTAGPLPFGGLRRLGRRDWLAIAFAAACFATTAVQIVAPADAALITADAQPSITKLPGLLLRAMAPVWENRIGLFVVLLPVAALGWLAFDAAPATGVFMILSAGTLLIAESLVYGNGAWHAGTIFLGLLATLFLLRGEARLDGERRRYLSLLFLVFLGLGFANGVPLIGIALRHPASDGRLAARFLQDHCPAGCTYVGQDVPDAAISAYLGGTPIYYVNRGEFGTYTIRDNRRLKPDDADAMTAAAGQFAHPILIFTQDLPRKTMARDHLQLLASFPPAMTAERFFLYSPQTSETK